MIHIPFTLTYIDGKSFLRKKLPIVDDEHGVYCVSGFQGSGKTYYAIQLAKEFTKDYTIWTNIHSLKLPHKDFTKIDEIKNNFDKHCLFIIDEISSKYQKESRTDKEFYRWLQQTRKRQSIVVLITQEWKEVPTWLRRPVKIQITTSRCLFSNFTGIFQTVYGDGMNLTYDKDEGEYVCPPLRRVFHKRNKSIADLYDTLEPIADL